jgi:hypothetical protein
MVGLPAMGKSTRVAALATMNPDVFVYSTDNYIERCAKQNDWTYDQAFAEFIEPATKYMNEMLDIAMRSKQDIVWDQTNLGAKKRAKIINRMRQAGYDVECECIVPLESDYDGTKEDWAQRLANRPGKTIPDNILYSMMDSFVMPSVEEGFERVVFFNMYGALVGIEYNETA